jgi:SNF2 family DNA or RNA helicase
MTLAAPAAPTATPGLPVRTRPWPHQTAAFHFAAPQRSTILNIAMGGGKGLCAVALAEHDQAMRVLVLCPKSVVGVWPDQFAEHALRTWRVWAGQVNGARGPLNNPSVARRATAALQDQKFAIHIRQPHVTVVNYEAAHLGDMARLLEGAPWDLVILDESHRIKAPAGKASKFAAKVAKRAARVLALTGTPMPHSPLDLWAQYRALDTTILGTSYRAFCQIYGQPKTVYTGPGVARITYEDIRPERAKEFAERTGRLMFQVRQEDLDTKLGLPETTDVRRLVDLEPATRRVYDQLERHLIADIDGGVVTAANAMVNLIRLAQAADGFAVNHDTRLPRTIAKDGVPEKARALADILEDLDQREPVVVFARFRHDLDHIEQVAERSGRRYGELSGVRRDGLTSNSKMSADIDVMGVQIQAGGVGIDLSRARIAVYYSVGFALGDYLQSRKRVHRPGQTRHTTYLHLLARDTVDHAVYGALRHRQDVTTAVLDQLATKERHK